MATDDHKALAVRALMRMKGDDLPRAKRTFRNFTEAQMQEPLSTGRHTRAQILRDLQAEEDRINDAIQWVRGQP